MNSMRNFLWGFAIAVLFLYLTGETKLQEREVVAVVVGLTVAILLLSIAKGLSKGIKKGIENGKKET
jgi:hypothetical protein